MDKNKVATIWFTGLSASGKTTLSKHLFNSLKKIGINNVVLLDGETVRVQLKNYKFDTGNREQVGIHKAKIAIDLNKKGKIVIISGIAHKKKWRRDIRQMVQNYFEIFLDCDATVCAERDYKDQYKKAIAGSISDFIGVSEPYEVSEGFDLKIDTANNSKEVCSQEILKKVLLFLKR